MRLLLAILLGLSLTLHAGKALAQFQEDSSSDGGSDSTFDPFSDYSEFEEGGEEESDINFFHHGRFFSLGAYAGAATWTESYGQLYKPGVAYGGFLTYFFDLRFAIQVSYGAGDHSVAFIDANTGRTYNGKINIQRWEFELKYYINTQNISRGLSKINPYIIGGFSRFYRSTSFESYSAIARDDATGFQAGMGLEIPIMNNRMFIGAQAKYHFVNFADEGKTIQMTNGTTTTDTGIAPQGDMATFVGLIGINF